MPKTTNSPSWIPAPGSLAFTARDGRTVREYLDTVNQIVAWLDCGSDTFLTADEARRAGL